ncbi:MAG: aminopeptidase P family protein [Gemmatimonadetes bacterium]|nr:aminopeptidase P family protein [Gemmatimonadota bacterium]MBK9406842.1 aminopeptidase P family protein [Gemmatimonadota bacterium]
MRGTSGGCAGWWRSSRAVSSAREGRLAALVDRLVANHLDGVLITSLPNIRYLTGFSGSNALLFVSARDVYLVTDFRYETQAADEAGDVADVRVEASSLWSGLWTLLAPLPGLQALGFESAHLIHRDFQRLLEQGERYHWRPSTELVEELRARKDADEVALIRTAGAMAMEALRETLDGVRPGMTELAVCGALERALRRAGSDAHPFPPIIASGPRSALPHARASDRAIAPGEFLLLDFGASAGGYCSDVTRTVVVGRADERQRATYEAVQEANAVAREGVRAGMRGREADALARGVLEARGLGERFGHGLGHGIGLQVHEAPRLSRLAEEVLPLGSVVTIEPGVYVPEWGGVRIEDDVHLSADGAELLTHFTRELLELT